MHRLLVSRPAVSRPADNAHSQTAEKLDLGKSFISLKFKVFGQTLRGHYEVTRLGHLPVRFAWLLPGRTPAPQICARVMRRLLFAETPSASACWRVRSKELSVLSHRPAALFLECPGYPRIGAASACCPSTRPSCESIGICNGSTLVDLCAAAVDRNPFSLNVNTSISVDRFRQTAKF